MVRKLIKIHNEVNVTETTKMREGLRELILVAKGSQEAGSRNRSCGLLYSLHMYILG